MTTRRTSSRRAGNRRCSLSAALIAACLVGTGWSASAAAAPSALDGDDQDLAPGVDLATGDYGPELVDLMGSNEAAVDRQETPRKVPYLFLTPRVATILEDVFGDDTAIVYGGAPAGQDEPSSTSPVADNVEGPLSAEAPSFDHSAALPRFQRQMYRTDI